MIQITESVRAELRRLVTQPEVSSQTPVRLSCDQSGVLRLELDEIRRGDVALVAVDQVPRLIASAQLAEELDGAILHLREPEDNQYGGAGLVLLRPRAGTPRPEWNAPQNVRRSRRPSWLGAAGYFRRHAAPASTAQRASL